MRKLFFRGEEGGGGGGGKKTQVYAFWGMNA